MIFQPFLHPSSCSTLTNDLPPVLIPFLPYISFYQANISMKFSKQLKNYHQI